MKKIKILYTIPNFDTAGSGKVLYDLAKGLDKNKFEVLIACSNKQGAFFNEVEELGLPIHFINTTVNYKPYFSLFSRIKPYKKFIKKHQIDIVHSWHWSSDWTEVLATRLSGAKFVYTKKAMTWGNIHWKIRSYFSNFIITINEEMRNYFPNKKNQILIPLGLDTDFYNPKLFQINKDDKTFKIITVANLVAVKSIETIINAIHKLNNQTVFLDIVGDTNTDYANELKQLVVDLKLEKQVNFLGKHSDIRPFSAQADLYIISSKKEGMPMALVEAMTMGIPVLGSKIPGIEYVLNQFPELLFEQGNVSDLKQKIEVFIAKTKLEKEKIGNQLRDYCIQNFSIQSFITSHENLYSKILKR